MSEKKDGRTEVERLTKRYDRLSRRMENMRLDITDLERDIEASKATVTMMPGMTK